MIDGGVSAAAAEPARAEQADSLHWPPPISGLPVRFTGKASEYFRVWIVNLCLTLVTFGVFSAWAKVRKKRFFYSNTLVDGTPFQYLGQPIPILKGRLIAALLVAAWYFSTNFFLKFLPVVLMLAVVLAPWVLLRTAAFNARYSAFRNMTFEFRATYWAAAGTLLLGLLTVVLTCGLGYPWAEARLKRFLIENTVYGGRRGAFVTNGREFLPIYLVVGVIVLSFFGVVVSLISFADPNVGLLTIVLTVVGYAGYAVAYSYRQARVTNLVWRSTGIGPVGFDASFGFLELLKLYATNALAIAASLGLLIPWASVRMARYRAEHFAMTTRGPLSAFIGDSNSNVQAAGAEVADLFDFDVSI